jgi:hypothetical protein
MAMVPVCCGLTCLGNQPSAIRYLQQGAPSVICLGGHLIIVHIHGGFPQLFDVNHTVLCYT